MLDTAAELFGRQGYQATGLNQLVSASGAPKGSLYFHFPGGKEQIATEALQVSSARMCDLLRALVRETPEPGECVARVVDVLADDLVESDFRSGCPLAAVTMDAAGESESIRRVCADGYTSWQGIISELLGAQGIDLDRASVLSVVVLSSIEGALLLAKTRRDLEPLRAVGSHLRDTINKEFV